MPVNDTARELWAARNGQGRPVRRWAQNKLVHKKALAYYTSLGPLGEKRWSPAAASDSGRHR